MSRRLWESRSDSRVPEPQTCIRPELGHSGPCNGFPAGTCWQHISTIPRHMPVLTRLCDDDAGANARNIDTPAILGDFGLRMIVPPGHPDAYSEGVCQYWVHGAWGDRRVGPLFRYRPTHWRWRNNRTPGAL